MRKEKFFSVVKDGFAKRGRISLFPDGGNNFEDLSEI